MKQLFLLTVPYVLVVVLDATLGSILLCIVLFQRFAEQFIIGFTKTFVAIAVEDGANIKGFVNTSFISEHGESTFPNEVVIENDDMNLNDSEA